MARVFSRHTAGATAPDDELYDQQALTRVLSPQAVPRSGVAPAEITATAGGYETPASEPVASTDLHSRRVSTGDMANRGPLNRSGVELGEDGTYTKTPVAALEEASASPVAPAAVDQSAWNTDGFAKPAFTAQPTGGPLDGWDATKWADPNHQTPKYVWGRIAAANAGNPQAAIQQMLQAYPGATFDGKDKIIGIPGLGPIDVFQGASVGQNTPQWIDEANAGGGGAAPTKPFDDGGYTGRPSSIMGSSSLAGQMASPAAQDSLIAKLQAQLGTGEGGLDQQTLERILGSIRT
jgi:hypothetical protein